MYRKIQYMTMDNIEFAEDLYNLYHSEADLDESDLIVFRLLGAKFEYSAVEFMEINPSFVLTESDAF